MKAHIIRIGDEYAGKDEEVHIFIIGEDPQPAGDEAAAMFDQLVYGAAQRRVLEANDEDVNIDSELAYLNDEFLAYGDDGSKSLRIPEENGLYIRLETDVDVQIH